jgi:transcription factor C subunit 7
MLEVIYVVRHAVRLNWSVDPQTGKYFSTLASSSPTGHPADPVLSSHGVDQSRELARHLLHIEPPIDVVYSSPWYRCLQTIKPFTDELFASGKAGGKIKVEPGIGEWFGSAHFQQPAPATAAQLDSLIPNIDTSYVPIRTPNPKGEGVPELHDRIAYTLHEIVKALDADPSQPKALLICTHAAAMIAIGRVLTGKMPEDPDTPDFHCYTASLSKYTRRTFEISEKLPLHRQGIAGYAASTEAPVVKWRNYGIRGYWNCELNGYTKYLSRGAERGWYVSSFHTHS